MTRRSVTPADFYAAACMPVLIGSLCDNTYLKMALIILAGSSTPSEWVEYTSKTNNNQLAKLTSSIYSAENPYLPTGGSSQGLCESLPLGRHTGRSHT